MLAQMCQSVISLSIYLFHFLLYTYHCRVNPECRTYSYTSAITYPTIETDYAYSFLKPLQSLITDIYAGLHMPQPDIIQVDQPSLYFSFQNNHIFSRFLSYIQIPTLGFTMTNL